MKAAYICALPHPEGGVPHRLALILLPYVCPLHRVSYAYLYYLTATAALTRLCKARGSTHTGGNDDGVGEYDEDDDVARNTIVNAIPNTIVNDWYVSMGTRSIM